ncbi:MAG: glycosyltransferase [Flavobacteriales bacterium]|nr:glycosyltransferase [Flavobacteriales bacterium]
MIPSILLLLGTYILFLFWLIKGVTEEDVPISSNNALEVRISLIVPFRDEEKNAKEFLEKIKKQRIDPNFFEVILIDDHSTDNTLSIINAYIHKLNLTNISVLNLGDSTGKKNAVNLGVQNAQYELIVQTDMDCQFGNDYLANLQNLHDAKKADLYILPVFIPFSSDPFSAIFQSIEFSALQAVAFGMALNRHPILCSAANLLYKKDVFEKSLQIRTDDVTSGDDIFFLHAAKKLNFNVVAVLSPKYLVETQPKPSLMEFIDQRARWAGKNRKVKDPNYLLVMALVGMVNVSLILLAFLHFKFFLVVALFKTIVERMLLNQFTFRIDKSYSSPLVLLFGFFYPFYIIGIGIYSQVTSPKWKNRSVEF